MICSESRNIIMKAMSWDIEETDDSMSFYICGRTETDKSVMIKVEDFKPHAYLELDNTKTWTIGKLTSLYKFFKEKCGKHAPLENYETKKMYNFKFKRDMNVVLYYFNTNIAKRKFSYFCSNITYVEGIGRVEKGFFKAHECSIDPIIQFTTESKIELAGWMKVKETIKEDEHDLTLEERKFASTDIDLYASWKDIMPHVSNNHVFPNYCSFDIECNSKNQNSKLPNPEIPENAVFQISMRSGKLGNLEKQQRCMLTLFNPHDIEGVEMVRCKTEGELLIKFSEIIQETDPDMFIGHNIMKFDWDYMLKRANLCGVMKEFMKLSRILGKPTIEGEIIWSSKAYKKQVFKFPVCVGRIQNDTLTEIERNYKLPIYSLNAIAKRFLKLEKDDITPRQLFMLYQITKETYNIFENCHKKDVLPTEKEIIHIKKRVRDIFHIRKTHGVVKKLRRKMLSATAETIENVIREGLTLTAKYCDQDTNLPVLLVDKLNLWMTMTHMANVMCVPISYLHTRGVQIKVLAQVLREVSKEGIIIPAKGIVDMNEKFQGAMVIEANPGDYKNVGTLDFASLYPTTMIAFNICYTTILGDNMPTPPEGCHDIIFESHVGCECDPLKRKKKKEDVLCGKYHYRFKKVKITIDDKGEIKKENEGILPRLLRNLLSKRKEVKWDMFKVDSRLSMHEGKATEEDIDFFKKKGFEVIKPGSLNQNEVTFLKICSSSMNAHQLSIKLSANSVYGALGAKTGFIYLLEGAASVTAMGRLLIMKAINRIKEAFSECKLVYGDTDSCMLTFPGKSIEETFVLCDNASKIATHHLKSWLMKIDEDYKVKVDVDGTIYEYRLDKINDKHGHYQYLSNEDKIQVLTYLSIPLDLEFENVYRRFLLLTKKRYLAYMTNKNGKDLGEVNKGVVLARRDNSEYLRNTYKQIKKNILDDKDESEVMFEIYERVQKLFTKQIPDTELIIYTGVGDIISYAKKKKSVINKKEYVTYLDKNKDVIYDPIGPNDPRLVYPNLVQCMLALKMIRRGTDVPPNTRLEYIYLQKPGAIHQGEKAEDYTYYSENRLVDNLKPDRLHYIEKQLNKPVSEILRVKFPKEIIIYEKLEDAILRVLESREISEIKQNMILKSRFLTRERPIKKNVSDVGWGMYENMEDSMDWKTFSEKYKKEENFKISKDKKFTKYEFKSVACKARTIIESSKTNGMNEFNVNLPEDMEVINICKRWVSKNILDKIYDNYRLTKRTLKKPTQVGPKLRINAEVVMLENYGNIEQVDKYVKKGEFCKIINIVENPPNSNKFRFDLIVSNSEARIIKDVPRNVITTFYRKDSTVIKDMLKARIGYAQVVNRLNDLFSPIEFYD